VSSEEPFALPDRIELTLAEAGELLEVLDIAVATARTGAERTAARAAGEMITTKVWPEIDDLLEDTARRRLGPMTTRLMDEGIRSPEAAERLGIRGRDVYMMLFAGELDGGPDRDGLVYFDEASIDRYLERHGHGVVAETSKDRTGSRVTARYPATRRRRETPGQRHDAVPDDTGRDAVRRS